MHLWLGFIGISQIVFSGYFSRMIPIHYPSPQFRTRMEKDNAQIFDPIRRQWITVQPEEWVRQNFMQWLMQEMKIPAASIAVEKKVDPKKGNQRFDLLVFDSFTVPWMMIELKSTDVDLNETVLMQLLSYTIAQPVPYIAISNGIECHVASRTPVAGAHWLTVFPTYPRS